MDNKRLIAYRALVKAVRAWASEPYRGSEDDENQSVWEDTMARISRREDDMIDAMRRVHTVDPEVVE